ncbi:hypothetical protein PVAP13_4KG131000 [Panicum virgatum]|uniref:Uncharacterized protein n=1 Tax=Panicum virgatum TaxID=38727 RepID=A0A8T0TMB5_PANVG|nr:hypothetical protein PVAP13_4KG131000 [Panicum virgatum]
MQNEQREGTHEEAPLAHLQVLHLWPKGTASIHHAPTLVCLRAVEQSSQITAVVPLATSYTNPNACSCGCCPATSCHGA